MNEQQVREHVRKMSRFYTDALIYVVVNLGLILIWAISGGGYFWPIWVIIGWGIGLGVHAFSLGLIPQLNAMIPFMTAEWEDQEVRRILERKSGKSTHIKKEQKKETTNLVEKISKEISSLQSNVVSAIKIEPTVAKKPKAKSTTKKPKKAKTTKLAEKISKEITTLQSNVVSAVKTEAKSAMKPKTKSTAKKPKKAKTTQATKSARPLTKTKVAKKLSA